MNKYQLFIILLFFSCQSKPKDASTDIFAEENKNKIYKFYDFDFELIKYLSPIGISEKIILKNSGLRPIDAFKENHLYYIRFVDQEKRKELQRPDTLEIKLENRDMDSLYIVASEYMKLEHKINESTYKIPFPPSADDEWETATIVLDLGFRGNRYSVSTAKFRPLYQYLLRIKNKNH